MALVGDMNYLTINGDTYEIADADARQDLALKAPIASPVFTGTPTAPTPGGSAGDTEIATVKYVQDAVSGSGSGSVTSVGISNASNGGLTVSGSPITSSGTITVGHSNVLTSAQTTQAVYPIKIDKNGHISDYGSAVTIPDVSGKVNKTGDTMSGNLTFADSKGVVLEVTGSSPLSVADRTVTFKSMGIDGSGSTAYSRFAFYISPTSEQQEIHLSGIHTPTGSSSQYNNYAASKKYVDDSIPSITLNSSATTSPSFYAPTDAGTNGYVLKSNGSGAPTWTSATLTDTKVTQTNDTTTSAVRPILLGYDVGANETTEKVYKAYSDLTYNPSTKALVLNGTINGYTLAAASAKAVDSSISASSSSTNLPTSAAVASFVEGKGYITGYTETDPVFTASAAYGISSSDITNWNNKLDTSYTGSSTSLSVGYVSNSGGTLNIVGLNSAGTVGTAINLTQSLRVASMGTSNKSFELTSSSSGLDMYINGSNTSTFAIDTSTSKVYIHNLNTPTSDYDAATKKYVDDSIPTVPTISLNGSSTTSASFYAPTTAGTSGQVLTSNGSGAPSWTSAELTDEKLKTNNLSTGTTVYLLGGAASITASTKYYLSGLRYNVDSSTQVATLSIGTGNNSPGTIKLGNSGTAGTSTEIVTSATAATTLTLPNASGTIALTSDIPTVPSNIVNTITTTAGAHTAITSQTGNVSFNVPTKTSHLTNDSGFVTTDEKVKQTPRNSTNGYRNVLLAYSLNNTETNEVLKATNMTYNDYGPELSLISSSDSTKEIDISGTSIQYKTGTYYASLDANTQTSNHIMNLPDKSGTIALTNDIPTRGTPTSGGTTLSVVNTGDMYTWNNKSQVQIVTWSEEE